MKKFILIMLLGLLVWANASAGSIDPIKKEKVKAELVSDAQAIVLQPVHVVEETTFRAPSCPVKDQYGNTMYFAEYMENVPVYGGTGTQAMYTGTCTTTSGASFSCPYMSGPASCVND